jgi:hypothetical protein
MTEPTKTTAPQGPAKPTPTPRKDYRVQSAVRVGKETHHAGDVVSMTEDDAASVGEAVTSTLIVPKTEQISRRKAGLYEVAGPGSVWTTLPGEEKGRAHGPGTLLELDEQTARDLGEAVKLAV